MKKVILLKKVILFFALIGITAIYSAAAQTWDIGTPTATDITAVLTTSDSTLTITGTGDMTDWTNNASVPWYANRTGIKRVVIGENITSIGNFAFCYCDSLTSVSLGNSIESIGDGAFSFCAGLTKIIIPNSVTSIGNLAFSFCTGLTSVSLGNSVTSIANLAFSNCTGLTRIDVSPANANYSSEDGVLFNKNKTLLIQCPNGKPGAYTTPNSVDSIGDGAFSFCTGLTEIIILNSVMSIGDAAFSFCTGLTSITCLANVPPALGSNVFYNVLSSIPICVPSGSVADYQSSDWNYFTNINGCMPTTIYTISGQITFNGNPLAGVIVSYEGGLTTTATDGSYSIAADYGSSLSITPILEGYSFTPPSITLDIVTADSAGNDFTALLDTYSISGQITFNGSPLAGVSISYGSGSTTTATDGSYSIAADYGSSLSITPSLEGYSFTPPSITLDIVTADSAGNDFTAATTVGITEISGKNASVKMYPNPVQNTLYIQSSPIIEQVSIYDISGRMLKQIANPSQEINVSSLAKGIYLVKVKTEEGEVIRKIVKE